MLIPMPVVPTRRLPSRPKSESPKKAPPNAADVINAIRSTRLQPPPQAAPVNEPVIAVPAEETPFQFTPEFQLTPPVQGPQAVPSVPFPTQAAPIEYIPQGQQVIDWNGNPEDPFGGEPMIGNVRLRDSDEMKVVREEEAKQEREAANAKDRKEHIAPITPDQWNAMTADQQNAIRFNTDLVAAVERDRAMQKKYDPTDEQQAAYDNVLLDVFGTTESYAPGGIKYAPETVALLKNLDTIPAQQLGTLDDFLKLDVAITAKQVAQIDKALQPSGPEHLVGRRELNPAEQRLARAQALTRAQGQISSRLEGELERGRRLISDMTSGVNSAAAAELGAIVKDPDLLGALSTEEADTVNLFTRYLADPRNDVAAENATTVMAGLADMGYDERAQQKLYNAIAEAARNGTTGGPWFDQEEDQGIRWRTPQQVADALGLPMQKVD